MIYVECSVMDMTTHKIKGKYLKSFDTRGNFNSWYNIAKYDYDTIMNITYYNPHEFAGLKAVRDAILLRTSREQEQ